MRLTAICMQICVSYTYVAFIWGFATEISDSVTCRLRRDCLPLESSLKRTSDGERLDAVEGNSKDALERMRLSAAFFTASCC